MTIPEAVALVLQASVLGEHRDILVLDMGEPVKILDLAHTLVRLSGKSSDDVEIQFTGLRNGEKLVEELFYPTERIENTSCEKIKRTMTKSIDWIDLSSDLGRLKSSLYVDGADPILRVLKKLVPEASFDVAKTEKRCTFQHSQVTSREIRSLESSDEEKDRGIVVPPTVDAIAPPSGRYRTNSA